MKHRSALKPQKAYITRRADYDNSVFVQKEAAVLAFQNGDLEEMSRRTASEQSLKAKKRRAPDDVYLLPDWLLRDLGGVRDPIAYLIKERDLTVVQGRAALIMRDHAEGVTVDIQGNGNFMVFVQGGEQAGMEGMCDKRKAGRDVWGAVLSVCQPRTRKAIQKVIMGHIALGQAYRLIGGDTTKASKLLKADIVSALGHATAYLGAQG